jgi:menaquinol-cytochrome c reductase iron-sulfur subunit
MSGLPLDAPPRSLLVAPPRAPYVGSPPQRAPFLLADLAMNPAPRPDASPLQRRRFLTRISVALSAAVGAVIGLPVIGFLVAPLTRKEPRVWRPVGRVDEFRIGETVSVRFEDASPLPWAGVTARTAAWLRRDDESRFTAYSVHCTHLGCPVRWISEAGLFLCPCHGGVYYADGKVSAGPPPKPLPTYPVRVRGGQVEIRTSPIPIA